MLSKLQLDPPLAGLRQYFCFASAAGAGVDATHSKIAVIMSSFVFEVIIVSVVEHAEQRSLLRCRSVKFR